jgi:SAM-dependent methyltransferase
VDDRRRLLLRGIDVSTSLGLELGPLANPVVTRDMGRVHYLDHVDTEALRTRYRDHIGFDLDAIVPIDHVMGDGSIAAAVQGSAPFDYVVASHIVEHVPDPVRWLADIRSVMRTGGVLALAVPDHRQCFDALRSPSVAADLVEAHLIGATVPSPRQVYDHHASAVALQGSIVWNDTAPTDELVLIHSEAEALERASEVARQGTYHDVHCWVFTPRSFGAVLDALRRQGLLPFNVDHISPTAGNEFFATLVADDAPAPAGHSSIDQRVSETAVLRAELAEAERRLAAVTAERDAITNSRSWRAAGVLRAANRRLRSRGRGT